MPLVGLRLIGHTLAMGKQCASGNGITVTLRPTGTSMLRKYALGAALSAELDAKLVGLNGHFFSAPS